MEDGAPVRNAIAVGVLEQFDSAHALLRAQRIAAILDYKDAAVLVEFHGDGRNDRRL